MKRIGPGGFCIQLIRSLFRSDPRGFTLESAGCAGTRAPAPRRQTDRHFGGQLNPIEGPTAAVPDRGLAFERWAHTRATVPIADRQLSVVNRLADARQPAIRICPSLFRSFFLSCFLSSSLSRFRRSIGVFASFAAIVVHPICNPMSLLYLIFFTFFSSLFQFPRDSGSRGVGRAWGGLG